MKNIQQIDTIHIISLTSCYTLYMYARHETKIQSIIHSQTIQHTSKQQTMSYTNKILPRLTQKVKGTNLPKEEKTYYHVIMLKFLQSIEKIKVIITGQHARQHDKQGIDKKHEEKIKVHTRFFRHTHTP